MTNNKVTIIGTITEYEYSHETYGEKFYSALIKTERRSGTVDVIPLIFSEYFLPKISIGEVCRVQGEMRSRNYEGKCLIFLFANDIDVSNETDNQVNNVVNLDGYICKPTIYRETPLGKEVTDYILAVNRKIPGKSDYIPCIAWGRNAKAFDGLEVGTHVKVTGRIQSREYIKKISEDEFETRTAYELSVSSFKVVEESANG